MFCPSCGGETPETMRFCRSCGMELQPVAEIIAERRSAIGSDRAQADVVQTPRKWEKSCKQAGNALTVVSLVGFCVMLVCLIPLGLAHPAYMNSLVLWFIEVDLLLCLVGLGLKTLLRLLSQGSSKTGTATTALPSEDRARGLSPIALPGVTEQTTKSLEPQVREGLSHRSE